MITSGRYEDAVQLADRCERYDRTYGETYLYRMQAHAAMCMTDKAIDDAILYYEYSSEPDMSEMESVLKGHLTYALAKVNGKISGNGDNREWRMLKTTVHELDHDYAAAVEEYNRIEKEYGTDAAIYYYRSGCYNELGYTDKAVSDITECMEMPVYDVPVAVTDTSRTTVSEIRMDKLYSGVYEVPCDINGLPLKFILDTGASTVSISSVEASVAHNQRAPLLLGQSVLERFGTVTIDNINSRLVIML